MFGKDTFCTFPAQIIQQVIAIPTSPLNSHLNDPWIYIFCGCIDRHCTSSIEGRFANNVIPRHRAFDFIVCSPPAKLPGAKKCKIDKHENDENGSYNKSVWLHFNLLIRV